MREKIKEGFEILRDVALMAVFGGMIWGFVYCVIAGFQKGGLIP